MFDPRNTKKHVKEIQKLQELANLTHKESIIAALEGMKIRDHRDMLLHFSPYKKLIIAGKKDPVLDYKALEEQGKNTEVELVLFPDGHMAHIENYEACLFELDWFIKKCIR